MSGFDFSSHDYDDVEQSIVDTALRIQNGETLSDDEQEDYLDAACLVFVLQMKARGFDAEDAMDMLERMIYDEDGESREVTVNVAIEDGELISLSLASDDHKEEQ